MPNHVKTRCKVSGDPKEIARFRKEVFSKSESEYDPDDFLDFNKIIPMPEILKGSVSGTSAEYGAILILIAAKGGFGTSNYGLDKSRESCMRDEVKMPNAPMGAVAKAYLEKNPEYETDGRRRLQAILETGYTDWYEWSCDNWNTKWNSYSPCFVCDESGDLEFTFDTAWSFPEPIFEKLAEMYPNVHFHCACFDEGWGFAGEGYYNAPDDHGSAFSFVDADNDMYRFVYDCEPETDEDDDDEEVA